jgi:hypothetical protein
MGALASELRGMCERGGEGEGRSMSQTIVPDAIRAEMKRLHAQGMSVVKIANQLGYSGYAVRCVVKPGFREMRTLQVMSSRERSRVTHVVASVEQPTIKRDPEPIAITDRYVIRPYTVTIPDHSSPQPYQHVSLARLSIQEARA